MSIQPELKVIGEQAKKAPSFFWGTVFPLMLFAFGLFLQLAIHPFVGVVFIVVGFIVYGITNSKGFLQRETVPGMGATSRWVAVTSAEMERLRNKLVLIKQTSRVTIWTYLRLILLLGAMAGSLVLVYALAPEVVQDEVIWMTLIMNAVIILIATGVTFNSGSKLHLPHLISFKLPHLDWLLSVFQGPDWKQEFQLELAKNPKGVEIPRDIKLVLKPNNSPDTFLGVQVQVSINRGSPYLYCVVVTKEELPIVVPVLPLFGRRKQPKDVLERKSEKDVNILVIRQNADVGTGYITNRSDMRRLLMVALESAQNTLMSQA